ncbi:MAG: hypothetical protein AB8B96_17010 [Lysobacterales bacterium]
MAGQGVVFPQGKDGKRSTTKTGKDIVSSALRQVDDALAAAVAEEPHWRKNYRHYFERLTEVSAESASNASTIAQNGLEAVYQTFAFERDGKIDSLDRAMSGYCEPRFATGVIAGSGEAKPLTVAYKNQQLVGPTLRGQVAQWEQRGVIEPSHGAAILRVLDNPGWITRMPAIAMLGAAAEMGPLTTLLDLGATVIAVDLANPEVWQTLIAKARESAGTLIFPATGTLDQDLSDVELAKRAGANLLVDAPEIATWLVGLEQPMAIGGYAYLDGGDFVRVSVAMDLITKTVTQRSEHPVAPAYLLTPTDVYAVPARVAAAADAQYKRPTVFRSLRSIGQRVSGSRFFAPSVRSMVNSVEGQRYGIINSLVQQQGPNYTLAKRLQRWRAIVARESGQVVSCNVAPATYTRSVTKNKVFAAGYAGAEVFGMEAFEAGASNAVMTALLIDDLSYDRSASHPKRVLGNPEELFMEGANHSGIWRMANRLGSVIEAGVVAGLVKRWLPGRG